MKGLEFLGVKLDAEKNAKVRGVEAEISAPDSKVKVWVIPTNEELAIARDTLMLTQQVNRFLRRFGGERRLFPRPCAYLPGNRYTYSFPSFPFPSYPRGPFCDAPPFGGAPGC